MDRSSPLMQRVHDSTAISKYLRLYAEPKSSAVPEKRHKYVVVVPAFREEHTLPICIRSIQESSGGEALVIVVINAPAHSWRDSDDVHTRIVERFQNDSSIVLVESFRELTAIPSKFGVGLARKQGCDLALQFIVDGHIEVPRIYVTDADAKVPPDYFQRPGEQTSAQDRRQSAWLYPFTHIPESSEDCDAVDTYDASLRLHTLGLQKSGSPYAYFSLGSILAVDPIAYAQVRGFPKRAAGEDFYILQKLGKVAPIERLCGAPILLSGRRSDRVPFGTGPAIDKQRTSNTAWVTYSSESYRHLESVMATIDSAHLDTNLLTEEACLALNELGVLDGLRKSARGAPRHHIRFRRHSYFDALKTIRFFHVLRDRFGCTDQSIESAITHNFWMAEPVAHTRNALLSLSFGMLGQAGPARLLPRM